MRWTDIPKWAVALAVIAALALGGIAAWLHFAPGAPPGPGPEEMARAGKLVSDRAASTDRTLERARELIRAVGQAREVHDEAIRTTGERARGEAAGLADRAVVAALNDLLVELRSRGGEAAP